MKRTSVNPWSWSINLGFDQGQLIEGSQRQLFCSGQDAVDAEGTPQHAGDMAGQLEQALDNLQAVLTGAEMTFANVARLNVYTTEVDEMFQYFPKINERFGDSRYTTTLLGVDRLAAPQLLVLLEATAVG
jgi:enamine deaminase RidA (YjgF/YER057c/UK114 family)